MDEGKEKKLIEYQHKLRQNQTKMENHLWYDFLKPCYSDRGIKVTRQKREAGYIVDFCCPRARLIIEVDGFQHYDENGRKYDIPRTERLEANGFLVIRYSNRQVKYNFRNVCLDIAKTMHYRLGKDPAEFQV